MFATQRQNLSVGMADLLSNETRTAEANHKRIVVRLSSNGTQSKSPAYHRASFYVYHVVSLVAMGRLELPTSRL